jgi:hypothetical protein
MASTYEKIATTTLGSAAATVTLSSISGSYTDLVLVVQARSSFSNLSDILSVRINSDTGTNYSYTRVMGDGSTASSARETGLDVWRVNYNIPGATATASVFGLDTIQFLNYSNTTTYKTGLWRSSPAQILTLAAAALWRSTSAITSITLLANNGNLVTGSTFTLYGIKSA